MAVQKENIEQKENEKKRKYCQKQMGQANVYMEGLRKSTWRFSPQESVQVFSYGMKSDVCSSVPKCKLRIPKELQPLMLTSQTCYSETCHGISQIPQMPFLSADEILSPWNRRLPYRRKWMWTCHMGKEK